MLMEIIVGVVVVHFAVVVCCYVIVYLSGVK